jgi:hypothetical protein
MIETAKQTVNIEAHKSSELKRMIKPKNHNIL